MNYNEILERISPCGLNCETCFAFKEGTIKKYSKLLTEKLGNFENYAPRFEELLEEPLFNVYPYFKLQLEYFNQIECCGCRKEMCKLYKACNVRKCAEKKGVDFCFQCKEFPCENSGFDENLAVRWKHKNQRMKDIGVEAFYEEIKHRHRYP